MGKLKWILAIFLAPFTLGFSLVLAVWWTLWLKFIKICIKADMYLIYFTIRIAVLPIEIPLRVLFNAGKSFENFFEGAWSGLHSSQGKIPIKRNYLILIVIIFVVEFALFGPNLFNKTAVVTYFTQVGGLVALMFLSPILVAMVISGVMNRGGPSPKTQQPQQPRQPQQPQQEGNSARDVTGTAMEAATMYSHLDTAQDAIDGEGVDIIPKGLVSKAKNVKGLVGLGGSAAAEGGTTAAAGGVAAEGGAAAAAGSAATAAAPAILAILLAIIILAFVVAIQAVIVVAVFWGLVLTYLPMILGPIGGALGLGGAYADWLGGAAANSGAGVSLLQGGAFAEEKRALAQAGAKMQCMLKGPQCLRQWQMNNTVRPGSDARGERYELTIEQFNFGTDSIDVAYKEANYTLPINFLVSNTRNGLKGISAREVRYRINIMDSSETYCSTGWKPISSFEIEDDASPDPENDYILPGLGVSPTDSMEQINLGNCELLQPSLGINRVAELQVKYKYSSQATLYVDAMSRENRRDEGIQPSFKKSETAKTPVQSYINVNSPISYYETESGERNAVPFAARFGFETPGFNVKYRIDPDSVEIVDSSVTNHTSTCNGLEKKEGEPNVYEISDTAKQRINLRQEETWFTADTSPSPLRCTMKISEEDVYDISPTGEQLIMRIDGNYTIVKSNQMSSFNIKNTLCSRNNCPLLVTKGFAEDSKWNLSTECTSETSVDSRNGCGVRQPEDLDGDGEMEMNWRVPELAERNGRQVSIQQGDQAWSVSNLMSNIVDTDEIDFDRSKTHSNLDDLSSGSDTVPVGFNEREVDRQARGNVEGMVFYEEERELSDIKVETFSGVLCQQEADANQDVADMDEAMSNLMDVWKNDRRNTDGVQPLMVYVNTADCTRSLREFVIDFYSCEAGLFAEVGKAYIDFYNPTTGVDFDLPDSCESTGDQAVSCTGVLMKEGRDLQCYGGDFED